VTTEVTERRFRRLSPMAMVLSALGLALMAAWVPLAYLTHDLQATRDGFAPAFALAGLAVVVLGPPKDQTSGRIASDLAFVALAALPFSMGVGILKYHLYDIDRIISRTLAYTIATGLLVGLYTGLVLFATQVLPFSVTIPVAVAASTLAAAALFNPLRRRVQRAVDRRFNRARYNAEATVATFAERLKDAVDLDSVQDDLASVVNQTLEPVHMSVWLSHRN
jgi:hypothetical protein